MDVGDQFVDLGDVLEHILEAAADARAVDGRGPLRSGGLEAGVLEQELGELGFPGEEVSIGGVELGLDAVHGLGVGGHGGHCRREAVGCQGLPRPCPRTS